MGRPVRHSASFEATTVLSSQLLATHSQHQSWCLLWIPLQVRLPGCEVDSVADWEWTRRREEDQEGGVTTVLSTSTAPACSRETSRAPLARGEPTTSTPLPPNVPPPRPPAATAEPRRARGRLPLALHAAEAVVWSPVGGVAPHQQYTAPRSRLLGVSVEALSHGAVTVSSSEPSASRSAQRTTVPKRPKAEAPRSVETARTADRRTLPRRLERLDVLKRLTIPPRAWPPPPAASGVATAAMPAAETEIAWPSSPSSCK